MGAGQADALKMVSVQVVVVGWRGAQGEGGSQGRVCTWGGGGGGHTNQLKYVHLF